jgi:hypothetical protein
MTKKFNTRGKIVSCLRKLGVDLGRYPSRDISDDEQFMKIFEFCEPYTMTSIERMHSLFDSVNYVTQAKIPGAIVECGVWKGGSAMLAAMTLHESGNTERDIFLYDTFEGMSAPTSRDVSPFHRDKDGNDSNRTDWSTDEWLVSGVQDVKAHLAATKYPEDKLHFVKGKVEETIPGTIPDQIAILRLDTDWYESTKHELEHLFPRLSPQGILIIDDYGYWAGAKEATHEYFDEHGLHPFIHRIDRTGVLVIKS